MSASRSAYLRTVPDKSRGVVERALAGTASPRSAIKAHCLTCSGFDRAEVAACTVWRCALHPYRPFQPGGGPEVAEAGTYQPPESAEVSEPHPDPAQPVGARQGEVRG